MFVKFLILVCVIGLIKCEDVQVKSKTDIKENTQILEATNKNLPQDKPTDDDIHIKIARALFTLGKYAPHTLSEETSLFLRDHIEDSEDITTPRLDDMEDFTISHEIITNTGFFVEQTSVMNTESPLDTPSPMLSPVLRILPHIVSNTELDIQQQKSTSPSTTRDVTEMVTTLEPTDTTQSTTTTGQAKLPIATSQFKNQPTSTTTIAPTTSSEKAKLPTTIDKSTTVITTTTTTEEAQSTKSPQILTARLTADDSPSPSSISPAPTSFGTMVLAVIVIATTIGYMIAFIIGIVLVEYRKYKLKELKSDTVSPPSLDDVDGPTTDVHGPTGYSNPTFQMA